ncbi:sulfite exporter TauE/SafE family protein [Paenisporosarcina sp. TG-14]|uniref:sulfite exporter TauE/SafE family protein n=1 Tax=Paenisporosarcina sp. TG-14 TaxID=1231057 RepID=UPI0002ECC6E5|nr:sulfite exporter TauE/SafE family protein [Paenisporosarcina sp. TG-14]
MLLTLFVIGLLSGIITGLLSVGGGIILIFSLLFFPPLILETRISMQTIAGLSIMQSVFSSLSGGYFYMRSKLVDFSIVLRVGIPAMFGGMLGVLLAINTSEITLQITFVSLSVLSAIIMQIPLGSNVESNVFSFTTLSSTLTIITSLLIGVLGGLVGLGAGFIFLPLMIYIYKLPIKKAIGSSLGIGFLLSFGSLIMKLSVDVIPIGQGMILIFGGILGAQIGGRISNIMNSITLKRIAAYSILLVSAKLLYDLLF